MYRSHRSFCHICCSNRMSHTVCQFSTLVVLIDHIFGARWCIYVEINGEICALR